MFLYQAQYVEILLIFDLMDIEWSPEANAWIDLENNISENLKSTI